MVGFHVVKSNATCSVLSFLAESAAFGTVSSTPLPPKVHTSLGLQDGSSTQSWHFSTSPAVPYLPSLLSLITCAP